MVNVLKYCSYLQDGTFTIFIDLLLVIAKSYDCWSTHSLPMRSTFFSIETINTTNSDAVISRTKTCLIFFCAGLKSRFNFEHLQKEDGPHNLSFSDIADSQRRG